MAEREGFEPSVEVSPYTRLAGEHLKPTRSSLRLGLAISDQVVDFYAAMILRGFMAEGEGFEPPFPGRKAVFKTAALSHSAIPPCLTEIDCYSFIILHLLCQLRHTVNSPKNSSGFSFNNP